jgi:hypothetical protein
VTGEPRPTKERLVPLLNRAMELAEAQSVVEEQLRRQLLRMKWNEIAKRERHGWL